MKNTTTIFTDQAILFLELLQKEFQHIWRHYKAINADETLFDKVKKKHLTPNLVPIHPNSTKELEEELTSYNKDLTIKMDSLQKNYAEVAKSLGRKNHDLKKIIAENKTQPQENQQPNEPLGEFFYLGLLQRCDDLGYGRY